MPKPRLPVRKIKEVLRLKWHLGLSERKIAASCRVARSTVGDYLARALEAGLSWPLPEGLTDDELERLLFAKVEPSLPEARPTPDWNAVHVEVRRKGVTLRLVWEEYRSVHPDGYGYSRFCELYQIWRGGLHPTMRHVHKAGEKLFVDYAGMTVTVIDADAGQEDDRSSREAQIFVASLGASNYTYAEATWTQQLPDWIASHVRAFAFFGGVAEVVVPDNTKSAVQHACYYEPELNPTYADMALHYGVAILPTRSRKPRDKAKVENAVLGIERRVLAPLRHIQFLSLRDLNYAIAEQLALYNNRPFQVIDGSRRSQFELLDQPALSSLPRTRYEFARWKKARAGIDYHVAIDGHYYSVPYQYVKRNLDVRITEFTIECFLNGERIASHARSLRKGAHSTIRDHMPLAHQRHADWSPQRLVRWSAKIGPNTSGVVQEILRSRPHPEHGYRASMGIMRLSKSYGEERVEAACRRALAIGSVTYRSIKSILKTGLDGADLRSEETTPSVTHDNIRGPNYYH